MQLRNFVFTLNNWTQEELDKILELPYKYLIYGKEGVEGTPHLQGYVELDKRLTFKTIVLKTTKRIHIESRKGNQKQAIDYCKKEGDYKEYGELRQAGQRNDLLLIRDHIKSGKGIRDLIECEDITLNSNTLRTAEKLIRYYDKPRDYKPLVKWYYGATGTGKTRTAFEELPNAYFNSNSAGRWWSGYDGQEDIIIDDVRPYTVSFKQMLGITDRYPFQVEDKGLVREFKGRNIIITAPLPPEKLYSASGWEEKLDQLTRRIDELREF